MQIVCPSCAKSYQVAATAIGAAGRSVRCASCQNIWFVPAPGVIPPPVPEPAPSNPAAEGTTDEAVAAFGTELGAEAPAGAEPSEASADREMAAEPTPVETARPHAQDATADPTPAASAEVAAAATAEPPPVALSDIPIPVTDSPPLAPEPGDGTPSASHAALDNAAEDIETVAARRRQRAAAGRRHRPKSRPPMPAVIFALLALCALLIVLRKDIVRHAPQMASLYASIGLPVNLRGLTFNDVKVSNETHDGVPVLVVEGVIVSHREVPVDVPRLRFALRNAAGTEVYAWTAQPSQPVLEPGGSLPFRSRLASPPPDGQDVVVRFFTRRDAVAGLP